MTRTRLAAFLLSTGLLLITGIAPVVATAATFNLTTPYPSVTIQPGNTVTFDLDVTVPSPQKVDLAVSGAPTGWTANVRGGGNIVDSVYAGGSTAAAVQLSVTVPQGAAAGSSTIVVTASTGADTRRLAIEVTVLGTTGGAVTLTSDFPKLSGRPVKHVQLQRHA